jgi:hypothetical protein
LVIRPRNAGLRQRNDGTFTKITDCEPLVDQETWETVAALITDPARRTNTGNHNVRLMSGLMSCGVCGEYIRAGGSAQGIPVYRCATGHVKRKVAWVDEIVTAYVLALLDREEVGAPTATKPSRLRDQVEAARIRLEALEDKYADGDVTRSGYLRNRDRLAAKLADLERTRALQRVPGPVEGVTADRWEELPLDRKRAVITYLVSVTLLPSKHGRHDPELVAITPRRSRALG